MLTSQGHCQATRRPNQAQSFTWISYSLQTWCFASDCKQEAKVPGCTDFYRSWEQDKVLADLEKQGKPLKKEKTDVKEQADKATAFEDGEAEDADPVEAALTKYGIITENPWEKGVKWVLSRIISKLSSSAL